MSALTIIVALMSSSASALAATPQIAQVQQAPATCVDALAAGRNRLKVKVNKAALQELLNGLNKVKSAAQVKNRAILVDYSRNSKQKRAYLIDFKACDVLAHEYVIHGGAIYSPRYVNWGEPARDGMLKNCVKDNGSRKYMTRPGFYLTAGCHHTEQNNWTTVYQDCNGIKLRGLEKGNREAIEAGIVLHEHRYIHNDNSIKPLSQGCPAFPPGRLQAMARYGIPTETLVYLYVPQCRKALR